jgi:hypothetical protein
MSACATILASKQLPDGRPDPEENDAPPGFFSRLFKRKLIWYTGVG